MRPIFGHLYMRPIFGHFFLNIHMRPKNGHLLIMRIGHVYASHFWTSKKIKIYIKKIKILVFHIICKKKKQQESPNSCCLTRRYCDYQLAFYINMIYENLIIIFI